MNPVSEKERLHAGFEQAGLYFTLLAEPTRLKILAALCDGERSVNAVVEHIGATQANVSRQLNTLYRSKILARRKDGKQVYYRIGDQRTIELCQGICRKTVMTLCGTDTCRREDGGCRIGGAACLWHAKAG